MNNVIDCPYFVTIHYIDKEDSYYGPAKICSSPYKCTEPCVENPDLRYRIEEKQEVKYLTNPQNSDIIKYQKKR